MNVLVWIRNLLHGDKPTGINLLLIYGVGIIASVALLLYFQSEEIIFTIGQIIALVFLVVDLVGMVINNVTKSTNNWYAQQSLTVNLGFMSIHVIHAILIVVVLDAEPVYAAFLYIYAMVAGGIVLTMRRQPERQKTIGMALLAAGILIAIYAFSAPVYLAWFAFFFLLKLVYCFPVDHYAVNQAT